MTPIKITIGRMGERRDIVLNRDAIAKIREAILCSHDGLNDEVIWTLDTILSAINTGRLIANPDMMKPAVHDITTG